MTMNKCYCECLPLCLFDFRPTHRIKCPLSFYSMGWWCQKSAHQCERFDCFFSRFIRKISRLLSNSRNRRCADLRRASVTNVMFVIYWFKLILCSWWLWAFVLSCLWNAWLLAKLCDFRFRQLNAHLEALLCWIKQLILENKLWEFRGTAKFGVFEVNYYRITTNT